MGCRRTAIVGISTLAVGPAVACAGGTREQTDNRYDDCRRVIDDHDAPSSLQLDGGIQHDGGGLDCDRAVEACGRGSRWRVGEHPRTASSHRGARQSPRGERRLPRDRDASDTRLRVPDSQRNTQTFTARRFARVERGTVVLDTAIETLRGAFGQQGGRQ